MTQSPLASVGVTKGLVVTILSTLGASPEKSVKEPEVFTPIVSHFVMALSRLMRTVYRL